MGLECFSSFWNNLNSFCKPHQASIVGENSCGYISFGHNDRSEERRVGKEC